jgi:hypothetical protein
MFRASQCPSSGVPKTVSATSGTGHGIGTATSFHRVLIRTGVGEFCVIGQFLVSCQTVQHLQTSLPDCTALNGTRYLVQLIVSRYTDYYAVQS